MSLMNGTPFLEHVRPESFYTSEIGVAPGAAAGFEAHAWFLLRGSTTPVTGITDGGILANGDGTDGWALGFDYSAVTGLTTFSATFGDTGGAAVVITSAGQQGIVGRLVFLSLFVAADGTVAITLNGDVIADGTLVGAFSPSAGTALELGAVTFGLNPAIDLSYGGAAYNEAVFTNLGEIRRNAAGRYLALVQNQRMWRVTTFQGGVTATVTPLEYLLAWDGLSLLYSGPPTATALDRNLPSATWLPRSGSDNLTRTGAETDALANLFCLPSNNTPWAAAVP